MTLFFSDDEIQVYRRRQIGSTSKYSVSATGTLWKLDISPSSLERLQLTSGQVGKSYVGYADITADIKEGDEIVSQSNGVRYGVKSVSVWAGFGNVDCKELDLVARD